jgi:hypothetical protein
MYITPITLYNPNIAWLPTYELGLYDTLFSICVGSLSLC